MAMASSPVIADDTPGIYSGAGAGYLPARRVDLQSVPNAGQSRAVFGGFRFNSRYSLEGFHVDIGPTTQLSEVSSNLYTQSFPATNFADDAISSVAGVSIVTTMKKRGPVRPFARTGMHYYDANGRGGLRPGGGKLLLGAGADIDLSRGWNARLEWERYSDVDRVDRSLFSARFEYRF
jgi:hypothetical protein